MIINILVVTKTARYVSSQAESFAEAARKVVEWKNDPFYDVAFGDPVYFAYQDKDLGWHREAHTVYSLARDIKNGEV